MKKITANAIQKLEEYRNGIDGELIADLDSYKALAQEQAQEWWMEHKPTFQREIEHTINSMQHDLIKTATSTIHQDIRETMEQETTKAIETSIFGTDEHDPNGAINKAIATLEQHLYGTHGKPATDSDSGTLHHALMKHKRDIDSLHRDQRKQFKKDLQIDQQGILDVTAEAITTSHRELAK